MAEYFPIDDIKNALLSALAVESLILLTAPPGAGKSTILPLWLLNEPALKQQKIYLLQPRRVAAKNIACYLAQQLNEPVGQTVGYRLRNDVCVSKSTRIEVITEGILTRIMQSDPELAGCSLIIFDEFHERSVQADLAFAIARDIQQGLRDDLTLLLMSATLASEQILSALPEAKLLSSHGRSFPITYQYVPANNLRHWREHALAVIQQQLLTLNSSMLVFLPSSSDIKWLAKQLEHGLPSSLSLFTLYGDLPLAEQQQAIRPCQQGHYKLVLATNIAETSLTIDGVNLVIDSGLEKVAVFDPQTLSDQLQQQMICKASAIQRAGRAGRLMAGHCIRLYSEDDFHRRPEQALSSIQQTDLLPLLFEAAQWGVDALHHLPLLELPNSTKEQQAWQSLQQLNIVDHYNKLTGHGQQVAQLACHPRFAHMIITAQRIAGQCSEHLVALACLLAALLEERDIFSFEQSRANADISLRVNQLVQVLNHKGAKQALHQRVIQQAKQLLKQLPEQYVLSAQLPLEYCGLLLALAYPERIAKARNQQGDYLAVNGKGFSLSIDDSLAAADFIVVANAGSYQQKLWVRLAASVDINTLLALKLIDVKSQSVCVYQENSDRIIAEQQQKLGAITLKSQLDKTQLSDEKNAEVWCQQIVKNGLAWLPWQADDKALLSRLRWLNRYQAQANSTLVLPDYSEQGLLDSLSVWFTPYLTGITTKAKLAKLNLSSLLLSQLDYQSQQQINIIAPPYYIGPTGRKCEITYGEEKSPQVTLPMQEMYGVSESPQVGDSKGELISLTLAFISPAGRPIQITQDLAGFWQGSYQQVQKEMKAKYPKHFWPDDPANAKATNKTKKYM